jgi:hypothetical protein
MMAAAVQRVARPADGGKYKSVFRFRNKQAVAPRSHQCASAQAAPVMTSRIIRTRKGEGPPPGCDQANIGTVKYPVHDDGCVLVPASAVPVLTTTGGFYWRQCSPLKAVRNNDGRYVLARSGGEVSRDTNQNAGSFANTHVALHGTNPRLV